jgi:tRNA dimethylallyltransferase
MKLLQEIAARGRVPLLVGGTMLYFRALFRGIAEMPVANHEVRAAIDARARAAGWPALHADLLALDPASAARIHANDAQRIQRALEVVELSGRTLQEHWRVSTQPSSICDWYICILQPGNRSLLHAALTARLNAMIDAGLPEEVSELLGRSTLSEDSAALRLVGYRQLIPYCRGLEPLHIAVQKALFATRQLAKRQMTWLRSSTLMPDDSYTLTCDPFEAPTMEQIMSDLIQAIRPP